MHCNKLETRSKPKKRKDRKVDLESASTTLVEGYSSCLAFISARQDCSVTRFRARRRREGDRANLSRVITFRLRVFRGIIPHRDYVEAGARGIRASRLRELRKSSFPAMTVFRALDRLTRRAHLSACREQCAEPPYEKAVEVASLSI